MEVEAAGAVFSERLAGNLDLAFTPRGRVLILELKHDILIRFRGDGLGGAAIAQRARHQGLADGRRRFRFWRVWPLEDDAENHQKRGGQAQSVREDAGGLRFGFCQGRGGGEPVELAGLLEMFVQRSGVGRWKFAGGIRVNPVRLLVAQLVGQILIGDQSFAELVALFGVGGASSRSRRRRARLRRAFSSSPSWAARRWRPWMRAD